MESEIQDFGELNNKVYTSKEGHSLVFVKGSPYMDIFKPHFKLKGQDAPTRLAFEEWTYDQKDLCFEG